MQNINPKLLLIASLVGGLGGWMMTLASWHAALTPTSIGGLFVVLASITATAMGQSIIKPK
jgi:hypothetical protein